MLIRKIIIAVVILLIPQTSFAIHDLYFRPDGTIRVIQYNFEKSFKVASGTARTAGQTLMTAANVVVTNPTTGKIAKKAVTSKITKVPGVGILGGLALAGVAVGGEALLDWLMDQNTDQVKTFTTVNGQMVSVMPGALGPVNPNDTQTLSTMNVGMYPISDYTCYKPPVAVRYFADRTALQNGWSSGGYSWSTLGGSTGTVLQNYYVIASRNSDCSSGVLSVAPTTSGQVEVGSPVQTAVTPEELSTLAGNGYDNDLTGALTHLTAAVNQMQASFDHYAKTGQATGNALLENQNALKSVVSNYFDSLDATDMAELDDQVDAGTGSLIETPEQQVAEASAPTKQNIKDAVTDAINEANAEASGETLAPLEALPGAGEPGDKGTIAPLIDEFLEGIQSLPVVSFFTDFKSITASGSCSFTLSMPNPITKSMNTLNLSFCEYQTIFELIGSFLLLVTTIVWIRYLFEG